jgi:lysophospholipase L1-like esterase
MSLQPWKKAVFFTVTVLPAVVFLGLMAWVAAKIYRVNQVDQARIYSRLQEYLGTRQGTKLIDFTEEKGVRGYVFPGANFYTVQEDPAFIPLDHTPEDFVIAVFGESSVVLPRRREVFAHFLEEELNRQPAPAGRRVRVYNFGHSGIDLFTVKARVRQVLEQVHPDLVVIYSGHNDYIATYRNVIKPPFYLYSDRLGKIFFNRIALPMYKVNKYYAREIYFEPRIIRQLQQLKLVRIKDTYLSKCNDLILEYYRKNVSETIAMSRAQGVPVVFMTLTSNYEARPFGINEVTDPLYVQGCLEKEYARRTALLEQAKDTEFFSGDVRAKSPMNAYLRSLQGEGVHVFDLEGALRTRQFTFDQRNYYDYCHPTVEAHRLIGQMLARFLEGQAGLLTKKAQVAADVL